MRYRTLIALLLSMSVSTQALAEVSCQQVIQAAREALAKKDEQISVCQLGVKDLQDQNVLLNKQVQEKNSQLGAFYRNPWVMGTIGALIGIFVAGGLRK